MNLALLATQKVAIKKLEFYLFILIVLASCDNKYYRTNFIYAVPTSLPIAPGLRTIQFLFKL
jgi:hypothetical protein